MILNVIPLKFSMYPFHKIVIFLVFFPFAYCIALIYKWSCVVLLELGCVWLGKESERKEAKTKDSKKKENE